MRVAVISDIHSNFPALGSVLEDIGRSAADMILCAGDIVGYGASPNECCSAIKKVAERVVLGNHDEAALTGDTLGMNMFAAEAARWTKNKLDANSSAYLMRLPASDRLDLLGCRIAMHHGSVDSMVEYVYEQDLSEELLAKAESDVLILGHTHVPYAVGLQKGLAVNPGSVGQPRDSDPRASYAVIDLPAMKCEIRRVSYNIDSAAESIEKAGLPEVLGKRLYEGH